MALYAISDLHLPLGVDKPMDVFGQAWADYVGRLYDNWQTLVKPEDTVVLPGDFSWATYLEQSERDFEYLHSLNGRKILLKGNHDYWWTTGNKTIYFFCRITRIFIMIRRYAVPADGHFRRETAQATRIKKYMRGRFRE